MFIDRITFCWTAAVLDIDERIQVNTGRILLSPEDAIVFIRNLKGSRLTGATHEWQESCFRNTGKQLPGSCNARTLKKAVPGIPGKSRLAVVTQERLRKLFRKYREAVAWQL